jgi:putative aldouronate transport system permease protein
VVQSQRYFPRAVRVIFLYRACDGMDQPQTLLNKRQKLASYLGRYWTLYLLLLTPIAYIVIFKYIPMLYIQIAFKKYSIVKSVWEMPWANNYGFEYFIKAFNNRDFIFALRNTIVLNVLDIIFGFPAPIILAIILNELRFKRFKRFTQTVAYMPHFLSWIIIAGLALQVFAPSTGLVNNALRSLGLKPVPFLNEPGHWIATYTFLGIWQSVGWNTIIYLAAITAINPELYEAAAMDGAGRLRRIWHVTLPGIRSTIVVLFIIRLGYILGSEFDRPYALGNALVNTVSSVIATFIYHFGIRGLQFSLTTAVGLFQSVVGVIFLLIADRFAKKVGERGIV